MVELDYLCCPECNKDIVGWVAQVLSNQQLMNKNRFTFLPMQPTMILCMAYIVLTV